MNDELTTDRYIVMERSIAGRPNTYVVFDAQSGNRSEAPSREEAHAAADLLNR